jgi:hypothetical protein
MRWIVGGKAAHGGAAANAVRLQLHALAYNLSNFLRTLATPEPIIVDESEGEAHQDRSEGRQPWALCRVPDGRGRHPTESVRRHSPAHLGTSTAASHINRVKHSFVMRRVKPKGGLCPMTGKISPRASAAAQTPTTRQKPPASGESRIKLFTHRIP